MPIDLMPQEIGGNGKSHYEYCGNSKQYVHKLRKNFIFNLFFFVFAEETYKQMISARDYIVSLK